MRSISDIRDRVAHIFQPGTRQQQQLQHPQALFPGNAQFQTISYPGQLPGVSMQPTLPDSTFPTAAYPPGGYPYGAGVNVLPAQQLTAPGFNIGSAQTYPFPANSTNVRSAQLNPLFNIPPQVSNLPGATLLQTPYQGTLGLPVDSAVTNANISTLLETINQRGRFDVNTIAELQRQLDDLQTENRLLMQQSGGGISLEHRGQLQLIATQMQLQEQALQTQLLLEQYANRIREQNIVLACFQEELQAVKEKLKTLEYLAQTVDATDSKR